MVFDAPSFWEYNQRPAAIDDSDQLTADSGQLPLASCEIVKKYIGYFFFPFSPRRKKAFILILIFFIPLDMDRRKDMIFYGILPFTRSFYEIHQPWPFLDRTFSSFFFPSLCLWKVNSQFFFLWTSEISLNAPCFPLSFSTFSHFIRTCSQLFTDFCVYLQ